MLQLFLSSLRRPILIVCLPIRLTHTKNGVNTIEYTSLITRIASSMGVLDVNDIPFTEDNHNFIDEAYLVQDDTPKKDPDDSLIFFSLGYAKRTRCHLYNYHLLTIPLFPHEEDRNHSIFGLPCKTTRSRARWEAVPTPQPTHQYEAGGSSWHSANTNEWAQQTRGCRSTRSSSYEAPISAQCIASSGGFSTLSKCAISTCAPIISTSR